MSGAGRQPSSAAAAAGTSALAAVGGALLLISGCSSLRTTERVFHGQVVEGHYIEPQAYAAYVEGAYREARGEWAQAEQAYRRALRSDGQSAQIWTRLGALACRDSLPRAQEHFERALALEPFAPAWTERARCLAGRQRAKEALAAALTGARLDPRGASSNLLVVRLYRESSQPELARAWLFGWLLLEPELETAAELLSQEARLLRDEELQLLVTAILQRQATGDRGSLPIPAAAETGASSLRRIQNALRAGELDQARALATEASVSPLRLATLALATGRADLALDQAELVLRANPRDSAALVTGLFAAALRGEDGRFRDLLRRTQSDELPPRELAQLLAELLRDKVGQEAAETWSAAYGRALPPAATAP